MSPKRWGSAVNEVDQRSGMDHTSASSVRHRLALRHWILGLALAASTATLITSLATAYFVQRQTLMTRATDANRTYAEKVATSIDAYLAGVRRRLRFSADAISLDFQNVSTVAGEVLRIRTQDLVFESVYVGDANGRLLVSEPPVTSEQEKVSIEKQLRWLSSPDANEPGRAEMVPNDNELAWTPLRDKNGQRIGTLVGRFNLQSGGPLNSLIGAHFYHNETNVYVVDARRHLIYHRDRTRIASKVGPNVAVDRALAGESGTWRLVNSVGADVISGAAPVGAVNWAVVVQEPVKAVLAPLTDLMRNVLLWCAPIAGMGFVGVLIGARRIARPLSQLADSAVSISDRSREQDLLAVDAWYAEAESLRRALLRESNRVHQDLHDLKAVASTDPLTGLFNRRAMDDAIAIVQSNARCCALISVDIDHFKAVNDSYGHDVGDQVLRKLALTMRQGFRENEYACRTGGEEFIVLLPDTTAAVAAGAAERLRARVAATPFEQVGRVTISLGVAQWTAAEGPFSAALKAADELLYEAKRAGRNRVVASGEASHVSG